MGSCQSKHRIIYHTVDNYIFNDYDYIDFNYPADEPISVDTNSYIDKDENHILDVHFKLIDFLKPCDESTNLKTE